MSFALSRLSHATLTAARLLAVTCVLSGGLVALGTTPRAHAVGHATHPGTNGRIVFMTRVMDNGELHDQIYSMNADGSDQRRLTNNPGYDQGPTWSKDGKKIAFTSSRYGTGDVFLMNADSSNQRQVTTGANAHWAKLSPDGTKIAYQGYVDHNYEIFVVNTDGTGLRRLTHHPGFDQAPQWSPDGTTILYMSDKGHDREHYDIFTIKPDGTAETRLTSDARHDQVPMWSPDGKKITFSAHVAAGKNEIFVMNADGTAQTALTNDANYDFGPVWSPDGKRIAFESVRSNRHQIVVVNPDGTGQVQLTSATTASTDPTWSPDSTRISYRNSPSPTDNDEVWVMNADGTGKTRLTTDGLDHFEVDWQAINEPQGRITVGDLHLSDVPAGSFILAEVPVLLAEKVGHPVTVTYSTLNGTATAGQDYLAASGTVTVPAGATRALIPISVTSDGDGAASEHFFVKIGSPVGGSIVDGQAQVDLQDCGIICNDDS
jgi:Tol biopolymer transport system component